jgi:hypothetical protein
MKTFQNVNQHEELRSVLEKIVEEMKNSHLYEGEYSIERILPPPETPKNTPAGYPHLIIQTKKESKILGLIPHNTKKTILIVKEGLYDVEDNGRKDMFIRICSKNAETIIKKHLKEYGTKNQITEIIDK